MPFSYKTHCFGTALEAAQKHCRNEFPTIEVFNATTTVTTSCVSVDVAGLTGSAVRLNLARASTNVAPTAFSVQTFYPSCPTIGMAASDDPASWILVPLGCVLALALGAILGQLR